MASDAGSALRRTFDAARAFAAAPPPVIALSDRDYIAAAPGNASNCHVAAPEGASNGHVAAASESASNGVAAAPENASNGHVAAAPESAENGDVAVGQAVLSQKRKKGGRTGESAKRVYQKRKKGGRTGESAKRVYRAQPIFATWSQERIFVPIGLLDGDELRRERWVVTEHGTHHCLHIGDRWLTGHLVRPGAVTPAFEAFLRGQPGIFHIGQEEVRKCRSVEVLNCCVVDAVQVRHSFIH